MNGPSPKPAAPDSPPIDENIRPISPPNIPDYELLRRIGSGSYGEVWLARNVLGQHRAVKIIYRGPFPDPRPFEREFEGIKRFEPISRSHPSQLHILHVGKNDEAGCFYYVMEPAEDGAVSSSEFRVSSSQTPTIGQQPETRNSKLETYLPHTLRLDLAQHGRLSIPDCLQIGQSLATALAHLHEQGLVHRDIKPSNILFVNGVAKLGDIGLVTEAGDTQSIVGTEGYLPPEGPGTPQADLFSLGKVLYEAVTGLDRRQLPRLPDDLRTWPEAPQVFEFNEIVLRACTKDPAQRYQTAEQLRADLAMLQQGKSIRHTRTNQRRRSLCVKLAAALAGCAVLVASGMAIVRHPSERSVTPSDRLSKNPEANKEYQEGVYCARRETAEGRSQGITHLKRAIDLDPKFAMAYNGLYEIYVGEPERPEVWECVSKMLELEPNLAEAHAALGFLGFFDWKWRQAEPHFRRAIELNPNCAIAHMRYGFCLVYAGRPDDGYRELTAANYLNSTPRIKKNLGHVFYLKRQFREAVAQYQEASKLEPSYPSSHYFAGYAYRALGNFTNSIDEIERGYSLEGNLNAERQRRFAGLRRAYADFGSNGYWRTQIEQVQPSDKNYLYWQAQAYAHLSDYERAFDLLKKYFDAKTNPESLEWLLYDECWDPVHEDPRFVALLRLVGLKE